MRLRSATLPSCPTPTAPRRDPRPLLRPRPSRPFLLPPVPEVEPTTSMLASLSASDGVRARRRRAECKESSPRPTCRARAKIIADAQTQKDYCSPSSDQGAAPSREQDQRSVPREAEVARTCAATSRPCSTRLATRELIAPSIGGGALRGAAAACLRGEPWLTLHPDPHSFGRGSTRASCSRSRLSPIRRRRCGRAPSRCFGFPSPDRAVAVASGSVHNSGAALLCGWED